MQERKAMFRLIHGGAAAPTEASPAPAPASSSATSPKVSEIFRKVLKAKLSPTMTVEDACHLDIPYITDEDALPEVDEIFDGLRALESAGLGARMFSDELPEGIVLVDEARFLAKFPELAAAVPLLLAYEGVQPYTNGLPRRMNRLAVV